MIGALLGLWWVFIILDTVFWIYRYYYEIRPFIRHSEDQKLAKKSSLEEEEIFYKK